jgi:hypothetical protein
MGLSEEFDQFWKQYPRRVAKLAAVRAFQKARRLASLEELLAGVDRYLRGKPDWQAWAFPASWLNAGRWTDEYDTQPIQTTATDWWTECQALHGGTCLKRWDHDSKVQADRSH